MTDPVTLTATVMFQNRDLVSALVRFFQNPEDPIGRALREYNEMRVRECVADLNDADDRTRACDKAIDCLRDARHSYVKIADDIARRRDPRVLRNSARRAGRYQDAAGMAVAEAGYLYRTGDRSLSRKRLTTAAVLLERSSAAARRMRGSALLALVRPPGAQRAVARGVLAYQEYKRSAELILAQNETAARTVRDLQQQMSGRLRKRRIVPRLDAADPGAGAD